jgi:hypothetical protein
VGVEETTRWKLGHPTRETCAACLYRNINLKNQAPLTGCGDYQAWYLIPLLLLFILIRIRIRILYEY